ncbi:MAG: OmpH family outer membrane protein [Pseudomonadota bacterium]
MSVSVRASKPLSLRGGPKARPLAPAAAVLCVVATFIATFVPTVAGAQQERSPSILIVDRGTVLAESAAARALAEAEREFGSMLQAEVDRIREQLAVEEEELARLRNDLPREAFEARADAFRERVQQERRSAQAQAAEIERVFREARRRIVAELDPILKEVLARRGADLIVNADSVLVARPEADVTAEVLIVFDARVPVPQITLVPPGGDEGAEDE